MKKKFIDAYMKVAHTFAELSSAKILKVGAIIVKDDRIISIGYNGTPEGWDNTCEYKEFMNSESGLQLATEEMKEKWPFEETSDEDGSYIGRYRLVTKPEVMHAERNALDKLAKGSESGAGATIFVTHAPCMECAKSIYGAGIKTVFYKETYKTLAGLDFLKKCNIKVVKLE
jgi:dCMP deaminase